MSDWNDTRSGTMNRLLGSVFAVDDDRRMPRPCPVCQAPAGHVYLHGLERGHGSAWAWCSDCRHFLRGTIRLPRWWRDLASINAARLVGTPDYLEERKDE